MIASYVGRTDIVRILVDAGADLNLVDNVRKYFKYKSNEICICFILFYICYRITTQH